MFKQKVANSFLTAAMLSTVMLIAPGYASAGLDDEMNDMFGSMSNVTSPGSYKTSRRGVVTGGRFQVRNKVMNTDIISLEPPSFSAGCGGVNFFGGSFSFINKDQFVQLVRTIASNAAGFAFFIALRTMSQEIAGTLENIQKKIQQLNEFMGNSCQLAQGLLTNTKKAFQKKYDADASIGKNLEAGAGDLFESFTASDGEEPDEDPDPKTKDTLTGNLVWEALNEQRAATWWTYGDDEMLEVIMSMSGTIIVKTGQTQADGDRTGPPTTSIPGGVPSLIDLVKGGAIDVLKCDDTECMNPTLRGLQLKGFRTLIEEKLNGDGAGNRGIISKIANNEDLRNPDERFLGALPSGISGMIFRLARIDEMLTSQFASKAIETLAIQMAYDLADGMLKSASMTLEASEENAYTEDAVDIIKQSRATLHYDYIGLITEAPKISDAMANFNSVLKAVGSEGTPPQMQAPGN